MSIRDLSLLTVCLLLLWNSNYSTKACDQDGIRLMGGERSFEGRVEVCHNGEWKTVCNQGWGDREARVVCRQLGFPEDTRTNRVTFSHWWFGHANSSQSILNYQWECEGNEQQLLSCPVTTSSCNVEKLGGVYCFGRSPNNCNEGQIRLRNGNDRFSGRVEICVENFWGTVCDDGWDVNDATTVCRQLRLSEKGLPTRRAYFGEGSGPIHLSSAQCGNKDTSLINCTIDSTGSDDRCGHNEDAGVICKGTNDCEDWSVRLVGGDNEREGRVEVCYNGVWGTVCGYRWDEVDASVVCIQLGYDVQNATALFNRGAGKGPILLARVACNNCHSNLSQCVHPNDIGIHDCNRDNTAGVICSIPLQNNTVSTSSTYGVRICHSSTTELLTTEPSVTVNTSSKPTVATSNQSQLALFGSVGAVLAVGTVAIVALLLVVVVVLIRRKKNKTVTTKEAMDNPVYDETTNFGPPSVINQDNNDSERDFQNPLYSDVGPINSTNNPTQNGTCYRVEGQENTLDLYSPANYEVPCIPGAVNEMPPTLDSVNTDGDEDNCYSTLGPTDHDTTGQHSLQHQELPPSVDDSDYSRLRHN